MVASLRWRWRRCTLPSLPNATSCWPGRKRTVRASKSGASWRARMPSWAYVPMRRACSPASSSRLSSTRDTVGCIKRPSHRFARKGLKPSQDVSDWMGSLELSANHFRAALARHQMEARTVVDAPSANATHHQAGASIRAFPLSQGVTPEALPRPAKSYQQLLREEEARQRLQAEDAQGLWALPPGADGVGDDGGGEDGATE